jgi:hypothetical protein
MSYYTLPTSVEVNGEVLDIYSDYRAVLDTLAALSDPELTDYDKANIILRNFYVEPKKITADTLNEAIEKCFWFISCGSDDKDTRKKPKVMDWEQDFQYIIAPINKIAGVEVRSLDYLHWWSFMGYYNEIGECTFQNIVSIRTKLKKGKALDKSEREFYRNNRSMIDFKQTYTAAENDLLKEWGGG